MKTKLKTFFVVIFLVFSRVSAMLPASKKQNTGAAATKALGAAIVDGDMGGITTAIDQGADVNGWYTTLRTPVRMLTAPHATTRSMLATAIALGQSDGQAAQILKILLEHQADANVASAEYSWAPLYYAAFRGFVACQRLLLKNGAHVDIQTKDGSTSLHQAVYINAPCALLLAAGADPTIRNNYEKTPLHVAAEALHPRFVKELIEYVPAQKIIKAQRERAISLLCCFNRFKKGDPFKVRVPKDMRLMLCRYAIKANVDALVDTRIAWLEKYFVQKAHDKTALELFEKSVKTMLFTEYFEGTHAEFANLINIKNIDQHRPTIRKNVVKILQDTPLWGN